uniref:Nucleic-acid-binding protein from transposon X-element n=1 Tax=Lygus hesperus TaxID=30085 RepID=A0A0A9YL51_LYGHE
MGEDEDPSAAKKRKIDSIFFTTNKFAALEKMDTSKPTAETEKPQKPPPIFVTNVKNINLLLTEIKSLCTADFRTTTIYNKLKLNFDSVDDYRKIIAFLQTSQAEYHTYQLKCERNFRVVIRGLHPTSDTSTVLSELKEKGFEPVQMLPVRHPVTKVSLPLFFVDLKPNKNNSDIYSLNRLYYTRIKVEPPKPRRAVIQCLRCQSYGHTKNYCNQAERCVRCDSQHATEKCPQPSSTPPVCVNCKGSHTANYKGCPEHKKLQLATNRPTNKKFNLNQDPISSEEKRVQCTVNPDNLHVQFSHPPTFTRPAATNSYAQVIANSEAHPTTTDDLIRKIDSLIALITPLIETLTQILPILIKKS